MRAVILKKQPTKEYDLLVTCYTDQLGKVVAVAKSALKPGSTQGMHLDTPNLVDFELVSGKAAPIITAAQTERTYPNMKRSLPALAAASFFLEVFDKMIFEHQTDERLWDFLVASLDILDGQGMDLPAFRRQQNRLLQTLGYQPAERTEPEVFVQPLFSELDARFEYLAGSRFVSLPFLYSVI